VRFEEEQQDCFCSTGGLSGSCYELCLAGPGLVRSDELGASTKPYRPMEDDRAETHETCASEASTRSPLSSVSRSLDPSHGNLSYDSHSKRNEGRNGRANIREVEEKSRSQSFATSPSHSLPDVSDMSAADYSVSHSIGSCSPDRESACKERTTIAWDVGQGPAAINTLQKHTAQKSPPPSTATAKPPPPPPRTSLAYSATLTSREYMEGCIQVESLSREERERQNDRETEKTEVGRECHGEVQSEMAGRWSRSATPPSATTPPCATTSPCATTPPSATMPRVLSEVVHWQRSVCASVSDQCRVCVCACMCVCACVCVCVCVSCVCVSRVRVCVVCVCASTSQLRVSVSITVEIGRVGIFSFWCECVLSQ